MHNCNSKRKLIIQPSLHRRKKTSSMELATTKSLPPRRLLGFGKIGRRFSSLPTSFAAFFSTFETLAHSPNGPLLLTLCAVGIGIVCCPTKMHFGSSPHGSHGHLFAWMSARHSLLHELIGLAQLLGSHFSRLFSRLF
jgi:hypothetical protein